MINVIYREIVEININIYFVKIVGKIFWSKNDKLCNVFLLGKNLI